VGSLKTSHQLVYAIGGVLVPWVVGAADSLNWVGTGAVGRWYFGPTAQPESTITMTRPMAETPNRAVETPRRVIDEVVGMNLVESIFIPTSRHPV
jgi:hypothetical protein